jgi:1-acyl-sn-glycerol-3-phosphate acyltransferase
MTVSSTTSSVRSPRRPWFLALARRYVRRTVRQKFDGVFITGLNEARAAIAARPMILAANHVCWWDAFVLVTLDEALGGGGHVVMDEENLKRLPFFAALGAVPVTRDGGARVRRHLERAAGLVKAPGTSLWFFPQGRQRAAHLRPLDFKPGLRLLARRSGADVMPVSLSYVWREAPVPTILVTFHAPIAARSDDLLESVERVVVSGLEAQDTAVEENGPLGQAWLPAHPIQSAQNGPGSRLLARMLTSTGDNA